MSKARMTVTVPDEVGLAAVEVIEQMVEEFFYANRENLGEELLGSIKVGIESLEEAGLAE